MQSPQIEAVADNMDLSGQNILFVGPRTFGYESEIKEELERFGCHVDWYDERPSSSSLVKALIRIDPVLYEHKSNAYFDSIIEQERDYDYNYVFVIKGEALSISRLTRLRNKYANAIFLYYTWDSLSNVKQSEDKIALFDKAYSFDRGDSICDKCIMHLPLFYTRDYERLFWSKPNENIAVHNKLLQLGSLHSDRYSVVHGIIEACEKTEPLISVHNYLYFQSRWVYYLRKLVDKDFRKVPHRDINWSSLSKEQVLSLIQHSEILIDVPHPNQTGLTMRTIECLGAGKKIITTNREVVEYEFYNPANILVVNRESPMISEEFLNSPYQKVDQGIYEKYSLREWLKNIFS